VKRIIFIVAGAAVAAGLTACSGGSGGGGHAADPAASHKTVVRVPVSCGEQYSAWARGRGKGLVAAVDAVGSAAAAGNPHALKAALKKARPAIVSAAKHQMPGCADPRGYWYVLLMHVNAAAAKGMSASSIRAALDGVAHIQHQLTVELKQTTQ
jgi:hypothetical protein